MKRSGSWAIVPLLWLAAALRIFRLDAQSFWNDEGNSARLAERSVRLIVEGAAADVHPPLYYLTLAAWRRLLGDSEFALRALSVFAGILLVAALFALGRFLIRRRHDAEAGAAIPLLASLFAATHPALVYYSQEARMYMLLGLWAVLGTLLVARLLPLLHQPRSSRLFLYAGGYLLITVAGLYTHYFYPAVLLAHNITFLLYLLRSRSYPFTPSLLQLVLRWFLLMLSAFLLYLPWLPIFLRQTGGRAPDPFTVAHFLTNAARWLVLGETVPPDIPSLWLPIIALLLLALTGAINPQSPAPNRQPPIASLQSLLPPLLILLLGATRPAYYKFMIIVPPFLVLLAAVGLVVGWRIARRVPSPGRWALRSSFGLLLALLFWGQVQSLENLYFDPTFSRADYRGIATRVAAEDHPNAGVILNAANQWEVFTYYHRDGAPVYALPRGQPDQQRIATQLEQITSRHERLYALFWGEAERDPQRLVERWLDAHAFKAREEWVGDVRFVTYAVPPEAATTPEVQSNAVFGAQITLSGFTVRPTETRPGDIVQITLFWQAMQALETRYKIFLHLVPEQGGPPVAQRDAEPVGNLSPTTTWQPNETVLDNHGLLIPVDIAPGRYRLTLGLYPLDDPTARLPVTWTPVGEDESQSGDNYLLSLITVR